MNELGYSIIAALFLLLLWLYVKNKQLQKNNLQLEQQLGTLKANAEQAEHANHFSTKQFLLLLNTFQDALLISDKNNIIQLANSKAVSLCSDREIKGKTVHEALLNDTIANVIHASSHTNEAQEEKCILYSSSFGNHHSESETSWHVYSAPLMEQKESSSEKETLYATIIRDTTIEHRANVARKDFVANASHELRTPLTIINGYLENLIEDNLIESPQIAKKFLGIIQKHSERLNRLVDEMLTISKLESGENFQMETNTFDLSVLAQEVVEQLNPMIEAQQASVDNHIPTNTILRGDAFYWQQILFNLIENALKQNPNPGTKVELASKQSEGSLLVQISDNGIGIPDADIPYIFDRFYRVQKHHSQNEIKGTGLGLSIVKRALAAQGATISVQSEPGIQTTFSITIAI